MEYVGYIAYGILCFLAFFWLVGVRTQLGYGLHIAMGSLFFLSAAITIPVAKIHMVHSIWIILSGFIFTVICTQILAHRIPLFFQIIQIIGSIYAGLIRIGIPKAKIKAAQYMMAADIMNDIDLKK